MKSNTKRAATPKLARELAAKSRKPQPTAYGKAVLKSLDELATLGPFDFGPKYKR